MPYAHNIMIFTSHTKKKKKEVGQRFLISMVFDFAYACLYIYINMHHLIPSSEWNENDVMSII